MEEKSTPKTNNWNKTNQWAEELDFLKSIIAKTELVEMQNGAVQSIQLTIKMF